MSGRLELSTMSQVNAVKPTSMGWTANSAAMFTVIEMPSFKPLVPPEPIKRETTRDPLDIRARFDELKALKDGWLDGHGKALSHEGLDWLAGVLKDVYPKSLRLPYAYPSADGRVQLEWSFWGREITLEVDFGSKSGEWHSLDLDTEEEEVIEVDLASEAGWSWILKRLHQVAGATP
ncbi:MAG: hypothetical protein ACLQVF_44830 [Isosphaeraceae bacterium]